MVPPSLFRLARPANLAALALLPLLSGCFGDGSFDWYCDRLNATPTQWTLDLAASSDSSCTPPPQLGLQSNSAGQAQSCGAGCSCTLSAWQHVVVVEQGLFGPFDNEYCTADLACTMPGIAPLRGTIQIDQWINTADIEVFGGITAETGDYNAQCSLSINSQIVGQQ